MEVITALVRSLCSLPRRTSCICTCSFRDDSTPDCVSSHDYRRSLWCGRSMSRDSATRSLGLKARVHRFHSTQCLGVSLNVVFPPCRCPASQYSLPLDRLLPRAGFCVHSRSPPESLPFLAHIRGTADFWSMCWDL